MDYTSCEFSRGVVHLREKSNRAIATEDTEKSINEKSKTHSHREERFMEYR
jgi:hypothetical protein